MTIRHATSEDSGHLPMQRRSDFAVLNSAFACGDNQACKLQRDYKHHRFSEGLNAFCGVCSGSTLFALACLSEYVE